MQTNTMKKKAYMTPASTALELITEGMIAESLIVGNTGGSQQLSNEHRGGWNSEAWTTDDSEE